jgi:hypothetical protein
MKDEMFDRMYQHGRAGLNRDIEVAAHNLAETIGSGLRALHRIEWSAPWAKPAPPSNCA